MKRNVLIGIIINLLALSLPIRPQNQTPQRIISMAPSLTESLWELEAHNEIIGVTTWCVKPPQASQKEKIGTLLEFNTERILSLKPTLILAMSFTDHKTIAILKNLGLHVETFHSPKDFHDLCNSYIRLGQLTGREQKAREITRIAQSETENIRQRLAHTPKIRIFWQLGAKPLFSATKGHFTNDFITFLNAENIAGDTRNGIFSREEVILRKPDVIIIVTMGLAENEEKNTWNTYPSVPAVKNKRIYIVDANLYCSPTPSGFARGLRELARLLRPETPIQ